MVEIIFLGTSAMVPTKERSHSSIFISYKNEGILLDCGEGTQRQLKIADIRPSKITKIFISHWDGDHVLGLPGLLQTLSMSKYEGIKIGEEVLEGLVADNNAPVGDEAPPVADDPPPITDNVETVEI